MTIAAGAVGKTSLKIVEALALATGRSLLGVEVPKRARVWLFNLEDDMLELQRRVGARCSKCPPAHLCYTTLPPLEEG